MLSNTDLKQHAFSVSTDIHSAEAVIRRIRENWSATSRVDRQDDLLFLYKRRSIDQPIPTPEGIRYTGISQIEAAELPRNFIATLSLSSMKRCFELSSKALFRFSSKTTFEELTIWLMIIFKNREVWLQVAFLNELTPANSEALNRFLSSAGFPVVLAKTPGGYKLKHSKSGLTEFDTHPSRSLLRFTLPGLTLERVLSCYSALVSEQGNRSKDASWSIEFFKEQGHDLRKELKECAALGLPIKNLEMDIYWRLETYDRLEPLVEMAKLKKDDVSVPLLAFEGPNKQEYHVDIACSRNGKCKLFVSVDDPKDIKSVAKTLGIRLKPEDN